MGKPTARPWAPARSEAQWPNSDEDSSGDFDDNDVPQPKRARHEGLHISTATSSTCRIEDLEEIINQAYDVEKGCVEVAFQKAGADRISNPNSLIGDIEAGNFLILKNDIGELLGAIGYEMIQDDKLLFRPFAVNIRAVGMESFCLGAGEFGRKGEEKISYVGCG